MYDYKRSITIDHTKVPNTDQTDFPVLVSFTDASFKVVGSGGRVHNSSGYDIGFFSDSALTTPLFWEVERYISTTGELVAWVKVPSLSHTSDTVIYVGYGDSGISTFQSTASSVWDSNFKGVYHLPDGTSLGVNDSTSGGLGNGTTNATAGTGQMGGAAAFLASGNQFVSLGNASTHYSNVTLSCWMKLVSLGDRTLLSKGYDGSYELFLAVTPSGHLSWLSNGAGTASSTATVTTGAWYLIHGVYDGSNYRLYVNGSLSDSPSGGAITSTTKEWQIGSFQVNLFPQNFMDGTIDEARISNSARSADWIVTEYNSQGSPSTFFTLGSESANTSSAAITAPLGSFVGSGTLPLFGAAAITAPRGSFSGSGTVIATATITAPLAAVLAYGPDIGTVTARVASVLGYGPGVGPETGSITAPRASVYGTGSVGIPGHPALLCFVGGRLSRLLVNTTSIEYRMNTRASGACSLYSPPDISPTRPLKGQEIKFVDSASGRIEFTGQINKVVTKLYEGRTVLPAYRFEVSFQDLSECLDRRTCVKTYPAGSAAGIARDIVNSFLTGENITTTNVTSTASTAQPLAMNGTAAEALKKLCDATGDLFYIDEFGDLNMFAPGDGGAAPFELTDHGDNLRDLSLTDTLIGFANNVLVRSDQNLGVNEALV